MGESLPTFATWPFFQCLKIFLYCFASSWRASQAFHPLLMDWFSQNFKPFASLSRLRSFSPMTATQLPQALDILLFKRRPIVRWRCCLFFLF